MSIKEKEKGKGKKMYKLISLDLDATVLQSDHTISLQTVEVLRRASRQGVEVMINTGRTYTEARSYIQQLDFVKYVGLANGSVILDRSLNQFIRVESMPLDLIRKADELARPFREEVLLLVSGEQHTYADRLYSQSLGAEQHRRVCGEDSLRYIDDLTLSFGERFIAKGLLLGSNPTLRHIKEQLEAHFQDKIQLAFSLECALEILSPSMDKANALHRIMTVLGLSKNDVMAVGDGENDIGMLRAAGFSVAMGNAVDSLKAVADYVTLTNDEDGVAHAVNHALNIAEI